MSEHRPIKLIEVALPLEVINAALIGGSRGDRSREICQKTWRRCKSAGRRVIGRESRSVPPMFIEGWLP